MNKPMLATRFSRWILILMVATAASLIVMGRYHYMEYAAYARDKAMTAPCSKMHEAAGDLTPEVIQCFNRPERTEGERERYEINKIVRPLQDLWLYISLGFVGTIGLSFALRWVLQGSRS